MIKSSLKILTAISLILIISCKTTDKIASDNPDMTRVESADNLDPAIPLSEHLRKLPGVYVVQDGAQTIITIKGFKSFEGHKEPLFVIDGRMINGGYEAVSGIVDVNDIDSIRVVREVNERMQYGFRGANGVIEIKTKG